MNNSILFAHNLIHFRWNHIKTNGIELGIELRENGYDGRIIYLTSSPEFAIDSYKATFPIWLVALFFIFY